MATLRGCVRIGCLFFVMLMAVSCSNNFSKIGITDPTPMRWDYQLQSGDRIVSTATILRPSGDHAIQVICNRLQGHMQIRVWPPNWDIGPLAGSPEARQLALGFDGHEPVRQIWSNDANGFTLAKRDPGFDDVIARLESHQTVTIVTEGAHASRAEEALPLTGARDAIEHVNADCKNPIM